MLLPRSLTAAVLAAALLAPLTAHAAPADLAALRESAHQLAARTSGARELVARARPDVRKDAERIVGAVDERRTAVEARIEVLQLAEVDDDVEAAAVKEMEASLDEASRLLATVEGWFRAR